MAEYKGKVKAFRKDFFFTSLALIAVGILFVAFPQTSGLMICYVTGSILCAWGIIKLIMYIRSDINEIFGSYGLVTSIALIIAGVAVLIKPQFFADVIAVFFGCVLVIDGVLKLQYSVDLYKIRAKYWWTVLILSLVLIGMGLLVVFNPLFSTLTLIVFTGVVLIFNGISDIVVALYITKALKNSKSNTINLDETQYSDNSDM
jgi:uncharacterized membrane protein HdeD (DUF308 family)